MFTDAETDPPADPAATIVAFLRWHGTLQLKWAGLDAADLTRRSVDPSTRSLLRLVPHMTEVVRSWFGGW